MKATTEGCGPESWLTASTSIAPLAASLSSVGSSLTHGAHQVAHRFTSTGLPLKSAILAGLPSGPENTAAGAASPLWSRCAPLTPTPSGEAATSLVVGC